MMFGRNRKLLTAPQQINLLRLVESQLGNCALGGDFSIRRLIADTLKNSKFDDAGIGCEQEVALTSAIGQEFSLSDLAQIEAYCKTKTAKELGVFLQAAMRHS